nr:ribonuclease H-like domain-containing protein [Tanacetum cinerariifolium]
MQKYTRFNAQSFQDAIICNMDFVGKYMLEIILHQQWTPQLLTQRDYSTTVQALNADSLKVDLVIIQNTCSEKENILSKEDLKGTRIEHGFKRAFMSLFGQDDDTFTSTMFLNVNQLQKQIDKDDFQEDGSMAAFWVYDRRVNKRQMQTQESKIDTGKAIEIWLSQKAVEQNQKCKMTAACQRMIQMLAIQISNPYMTKSRWLSASASTAFADVLAKNSGTDNKTRNKSMSLIGDQLSRLMNLLTDSGVSSANSSMGGLTVGHPNGTQALITKIGNLKVNNDITLYDVLVVPEYTVSLLSMHKLAKDSKLLGHPADQVLNVLNKSLNLDSQSVSDHLCDTCNKAKQTREPFSLSDYKSTKIRQLVHPDVWRPYKITSRDGFRYFLTIVDDYSRAVWTYVLKGKDDVYNSIINFVNMLSKQFETNVKVFRSDNSSEFVNNILQNSAGDINDSSEPISKIGDLPVNTVRSLNRSVEPSCYEHAILDNNWIDAMNSEIEALNKNHTWIITDLPPNRKPIKCKWIYKIKYKSSGDIERYKARIVTKGFSQRDGIDFDNTFSPDVKMTIVRCVIALSVENKWPLFQLDVNNAFLYGDLDGEIYMTIPQDFSDKDNKGKLCKLVKSLYGLKQPPRKWNEKLVGVLKDHGFTQSVNDRSLFTLTKKDKFIALLVYVDDIFITGNCVDEINEFKIYLKSKFNIKDLGSLKYFLGIEVIKIGNDLCLNQRKYCLILLKEYGLLGCKLASTPMEPNSVLPYVPTDSDPLLDNITGYQQLLGKLIYLTHTRPDISYSVHSLAELMHSSFKSYLSCALNVLRYLKGAHGKGIKYTHTNNGNNLVGYSDVDWAKCVKTRKSVTGYCVFFNNCLISWKSKNRTLCPDHPHKHNIDPCLLPHVKSFGFKNFSMILKLK